MNEEHLELLRSEEWRDSLRDYALPYAFGDLSDDELGDDVLEIGPGPGLTTDLLSARLPHITGIELDTELADALRARLGGTNVDVVTGDATAMGFESDRFSGAVSFTMLHHVPTVELQDRLFAEACRVLRPGALLIAGDSVASEDLAAFHTDDVYNPIDPDQVGGRLHDAGFTDIAVRTDGLWWAAQARRG